MWYRWKGILLKRRVQQSEGRTSGATGQSPRPVLHGEDDLYSRFVHGENVSDDDDDYDPLQEASVHANDSDTSNSDESDVEDGEQVERTGIEAAGLYSDLLCHESTSASENFAPMMLAHMSPLSSSPLTRRRYGSLVAQPTLPFHASDKPQSLEREHRTEVSLPAMDNSNSLEGRMSCVICATEPRDIICWPCRCLALCNDCRENLASRAPASKHSCPCCRRRYVIST
jgi:hypothetical protein